jgi:glycosyltransferase involved in cell wall biosynthesis
MKLLISTPIRFQSTPDGAVWAKQTSDSYAFWTRYLTGFDSVMVLGRVRPVDAAPAGWLRCDGAGVTFSPIPDYVGPYQLARRWFSVRRCVRQVTQAAQDADAIVLRVPCTIGMLVWKSIARGRPYGVEVVGDPQGTMAQGAIEDRLRPIWRWLLPYYLRRICRGATTAAYVTRYALQRLYPPQGSTFSTSYADVLTTYYSSIDLRPHVVANEPRNYSMSQTEYTLICVGAMEVMYKRQDVLIKACALCVQRGLDLRLVLVGDGKMRKRLEELAREIGMTSRTTFSGQVSREGQITDALDKADLFVLPSRTEGLPRAMIEAMARGLPCIGSDVGGIPELISASFLVPPDDVPALAAKIQEVLTTPGRLREMSKENLSRIPEYSEDILRHRRQAFYDHLSSETARWNAAGSLPVLADGTLGVANR